MCRETHQEFEHDYQQTENILTPGQILRSTLAFYQEARFPFDVDEEWRSISHTIELFLQDNNSVSTTTSKLRTDRCGSSRLAQVCPSPLFPTVYILLSQNPLHCAYLSSLSEIPIRPKTTFQHNKTRQHLNFKSITGFQDLTSTHSYYACLRILQ
jgi:hypothetical protein